MNSLELMESKVGSFSKTDRRIYESVKKFPKQFATNSISEISNAASVTKPAMTRFAKKLGFSGFTEFQYQLAQDLKELENHPAQSTRAEMFAGLLKQVEDSVDRGVVRELLQRMKKSRKVIVLGSNLSRLPAEAMMVTLSLENDICSMMPPADLMPFHYSEDDLVIIYSAITGSTHQEFLKNFRQSDRTRPYMVLITVNPKHPLRHNFDQTITLPTIPLKESSDVVLSDTFSFLMFNDIFSQVMHDYNESEEEK